TRRSADLEATPGSGALRANEGAFAPLARVGGGSCPRRLVAQNTLRIESGALSAQSTPSSTRSGAKVALSESTRLGRDVEGRRGVERLCGGFERLCGGLDRVRRRLGSFWRTRAARVARPAFGLEGRSRARSGRGLGQRRSSGALEPSEGHVLLL